MNEQKSIVERNSNAKDYENFIEVNHLPELSEQDVKQNFALYEEDRQPPEDDSGFDANNDVEREKCDNCGIFHYDAGGKYGDSIRGIHIHDEECRKKFSPPS